jgi:ABC-2 type transport system ATP-binding protein
VRIRLKNLTKRYPDGRQALKGVSLDLGPGLFGLLGPNGAGKSTLLSILAFLMEPTSGTVEVEGLQLPGRLHDFRRRLGFLPQEVDFFPLATGRETLDYFGRLFSLDKLIRQEKIEKLIHQVGLGPAANRKTRDYSVGMKKRLGVAQALLGEPKFLILDEPTSGLDPEERVAFCNDLSALSQDRVVILSTHIVSDVEQICSRMGILDQGQLVFEGAPWDFVKVAEGKTWLVHTSRDYNMAENTDLTLIHRLEQDDSTILRVISDTSPSPDASLTAPNLEDAYVCHFRDQFTRSGGL